MDDPSGSPAAGPTTDRAVTEQRIRVYQRQLRRLTSELSLAEARERRAIASDLHDHLGQALAYVSQRVSLLQGNAVFSGMEKEFSEILSILSQAIKYTRNLTVEISPPVLYELGLSVAIDWLAERASQRYSFLVSSTQSGSPQEITEDVSVFVFKSVQELINNVAKHAQASQLTINTNWQKDRLEVVVSDDGRGFDTSLFNAGLADADCFGLFSIRERLSYMGGELSIDSATGKGSRITLYTPYRIASEADDD